MTTIAPYEYETAEGLARQVYEDINRTYGIKAPHGIYQMMGHTPEFLSASWQRSRHLFGTDPKDTSVSLSRFSLKEKHFVTLAVSAVNNCEYCVRIHTLRLHQLGMTRAEHVELLSVVAATSGFDRLAEGLRAGDRPTIPAADDAREIAPVMAEIRRSEGSRDTEDLYRLIAHRPDLLEGQWALAKKCFDTDGALGLRAKHMVAFGVAAADGADYFIRQHGSRLRALGLSDEDMAELLLTVDLTCGYNRYVQGLQILPETVNTFTPRKLSEPPRPSAALAD